MINHSNNLEQRTSSRFSSVRYQVWCPFHFRRISSEMSGQSAASALTSLSIKVYCCADVVSVQFSGLKKTCRTVDQGRLPRPPSCKKPKTWYGLTMCRRGIAAALMQFLHQHSPADLQKQRPWVHKGECDPT